VSETIDEYIARMRREIRRFYRWHPREFREIVTEFWTWADADTGDNGKSIPAPAYADLLAAYENAKAAGCTRNKFVARYPRGFKWSSRGKDGVWIGETIKDAIKDAQRMARTDPAFRREVDEARISRRDLEID
jgi:hypothetical protein